ncbi:flagellar biosynthesis regulator FlaF [Methylocapsa palsarum]
MLIEDLTAADNDLPEALRANLVSIGLWIIKETDLIRCGSSENFCGLIEICATIRDGLK